MLQVWRWAWMAGDMIGARCYRPRRMMGRGVDGGCGTEEKPCRPVFRAAARLPAKQPLNCEKALPVIGTDFYSQARKALSDRSPFDTEDVQLSTVPTLPIGVANLLSRNSDSRKRHKKSHLGLEAKSSKLDAAEKVPGSNFWAETEEYFRELTVDDIERLSEDSSFVLLANDDCLSVPVLENLPPDNVDNGDYENGGSASGLNLEGLELALEDDLKEEVGELMEVDSIGANVSQQEKGCALQESSTLFSGLEWLLGSRSKIYLTSERPSKKRKFLGGQAGLEKLLVATPVDCSSSLCHYCSRGDLGDLLNRLIVCSSCSVAIHQRCYGVQDDFVGSWLCAWCKQRNGTICTDRPCLLCPKPGGALKPVSGRGFGTANGVQAEYVHLFCCQWMPEVYVEDTRMMEPIMNVEGIKETRKKLVCYLCKVKFGFCVRCSNGACRTSFHPICAREAKHRMEIWGKFGCDDVELRAFCSKHSEVLNSSNTQVEDLSDATGSHSHMSSIVSRPHKLKIGRKNGDELSVHIETTDTDSAKLNNNALHGELFLDCGSNISAPPNYDGGQQPVNKNIIEWNSVEDLSSSDNLNYILLLKKLIDFKKVDVKDISSEIGVSSDLLASMLSDDCLAPDLNCKVISWLRSHAYIGNSQKNMKFKIKSTIPCNGDMGVADNCDAAIVSESNIADSVPVKSVPPRRRTKSNIRILKSNKVMCSSKEMTAGDNSEIYEVRSGQASGTDQCCPSQEFVPESSVKISLERVGTGDNLARASINEGCNLSEGGGQVEDVAICNPNTGNTLCLYATNKVPAPIKSETLSRSYVHPLIQNKLIQMQNDVISRGTAMKCDGSRGREISPILASSSSGICCSRLQDSASKFDGSNVEQLVSARNRGILELSPVDDVEGELIFYQHKLLCNAVSRKNLCDDLICKVVKTIPHEIDAVCRQRWDAVLVHQYLCKLREAKKQGRKERRHREAQAVLAAATAAAAASSRISSFRKDNLDESNYQETMQEVNNSGGRSGLGSHQMPRVKETLAGLPVPQVSSEKNSDFFPMNSEFSKEHSKICDICRRSETMLNPILVCSSCKVSVHLDCYRSVKKSSGPWFCELCEDLSLTKTSGASSVVSWEKPFIVAECGLCGGKAGAFRRSADGQWVHAFCAEWVLVSTFRRGQVNPVEALCKVSRGSDICHLCRRKHGVCIKCSYGHCRSSFHPSCARNAGFFMNVRTVGGKVQHKAYCEKHSLEQRAKAESQKHGIEELKSLKQVRVELERLRLLCERIIKREKLKRELVLCSHEILASRRETVAFSALVRSSFFQSDVSSESATTSLKGYTDGYKSGSEAMQRSDDVTVDSTIAGKRRVKFPALMDHDQKTDDSSTSQYVFAQKPKERASLSGKQIPHRASISYRNVSDDGERRSRHRKTETFEKELVMTSDQACMKNQRLPKGFVYVPIRCLSNEKDTVADTSARETLEHNG